MGLLGLSGLSIAIKVLKDFSYAILDAIKPLFKFITNGNGNLSLVKTNIHSWSDLYFESSYTLKIEQGPSVEKFKPKLYNAMNPTAGDSSLNQTTSSASGTGASSASGTGFKFILNKDIMRSMDTPNTMWVRGEEVADYRAIIRGYKDPAIARLLSLEAKNYVTSLEELYNKEQTLGLVGDKSELAKSSALKE